MIKVKQTQPKTNVSNLGGHGAHVFYQVQAEKPADIPRRTLRNTEQKHHWCLQKTWDPWYAPVSSCAECLVRSPQMVTNTSTKKREYRAILQEQKKSTNCVSCALMSTAWKCAEHRARVPGPCGQGVLCPDETSVWTRLTCLPTWLTWIL